MKKRWTLEEIQFLKENYGKKDLTFVIGRLNRSIESVVNKAFVLGLCRQNHRLTEEHERNLRQLHAEKLSDREIATRLLFCSKKRGTIAKWRKQLGLPANHRRDKPRSGISKFLDVQKKERKNYHTPPHLTEKGMASRWIHGAVPEDEEEFLRAILAFRNKNHRAPTLIEGFRIAQSLGWRKVE
jgi:hypothetical protein